MICRGILFDKDGTLIESHDVWAPLYRSMLMRMKGLSENAANALLAQAGYDVEQDRVVGGSVIAGGTTAQLVQLWWPHATAAEREDIVMSIDATDKQAQALEVTAIVALKPLLEKLRQKGLRLGVATNDSLASSNRHLSQLGILELFDVVICADTVATPKPAGDMIRKFAELTDISAHEIMMIGDNHHDMDEAANGGAGFRVAVLSGNSSRAELTEIADVVLNDIGELPEHLEVLGVL